MAEPRAAYLQRPPLVTDASVIAAALFGEGGRDEAVALLHGRTLHAPHLLDYEIIERHAVDAETLITLAQRYDLTAYDAAYLCVAEQLTAPLATLDDKLAAAARSYLTADRQVHEPPKS